MRPELCDLKHERILLLVPDLFDKPGGIARYCRMVCRALTGSHCDLMVVSLLDALPTREYAAKMFPLLHYFPCYGSRTIFIWHSVAAALSWRPTIIFTGHPHFAPVCWMLARFSGAKMLSMMYGIDVWNPLKPVRRWALQQSDQLIAISHFTAQQATAQNGVELAKVRILYNCLAQSFTSQTQHPKQPSTQLSMLTVARMDLSEQYKGHDYVIRAMSQLLERFPDLVYHIIGDGNGRSALEDLAVQEGVAHAVEFHGFVDEETLRKHYTEASLFIMPSRGEGFGFVFLEAMAQGKPVIGGNLDATPEVVVDGKTGYLVNPTSVEEIVSAVTRLLEDSSLRERIGAAAREHVEKDFSFLGFQQQLIDILCDTLSDKI